MPSRAVKLSTMDTIWKLMELKSIWMTAESDGRI